MALLPACPTFPKVHRHHQLRNSGFTGPAAPPGDGTGMLGWFIQLLIIGSGQSQAHVHLRSVTPAFRESALCLPLHWTQSPLRFLQGWLKFHPQPAFSYAPWKTWQIWFESLACERPELCHDFCESQGLWLLGSLLLGPLLQAHRHCWTQCGPDMRGSFAGLHTHTHESRPEHVSFSNFPKDWGVVRKGS